MLKKFLSLSLLIILSFSLASCNNTKDEVKIGVSFGVGAASRWPKELKFMEERAKELGIQIETRLNTTELPKTQVEDCKELIDSGIDVLILTPRNVDHINEVIDYAKQKKVKVVAYARVPLNQKVDLYVGYDCNRIGQTQGKYLSEMVLTGDYIFLKGDPGDHNAILLYEGAMRYLNPIKSNINVILDVEIANWSAEVAEQQVYDAVKANGNKINAILAPNDKLAGAAAAALEKLNITNHVVITGMDAELDALKRIVAGKQDSTTYLDIKELANTAIDEAYNLALNKKVNINSKFENGIAGGVDSNLISGSFITKQNIDKSIIEAGYFTKEEIYGLTN